MAPKNSQFPPKTVSRDDKISNSSPFAKNFTFKIGYRPLEDKKIAVSRHLPPLSRTRQISKKFRIKGDFERYYTGQ
jgi:hypothetical protein